MTKVMADGGVASPALVARLVQRGLVTRNGGVLQAKATIRQGDRICIDGVIHTTVAGGADRLQLLADPSDAFEPRPVRLHAGLHKCLTLYFYKIYTHTAKLQSLSGRGLTDQATGFRHYYHRADGFSWRAATTAIASLSGNAVDLTRFADIRVVRVVRDPRDLVVSGYHYHRKGVEHWCHYPEPQTVDWAMVGGMVSEPLAASRLSLIDYLGQSSLDAGLRAEIAFRAQHFAALRAWADDPRVLVLRYEDILGQEAQTTARIARHFGWPAPIRIWASAVANQFRAGRREVWSGHIRDPKAGQWRSAFSPELTVEFARDWGDVLERYGYAAS